MDNMNGFNDNFQQASQQIPPQQIPPQQAQSRPTTILVTPYVDPTDDNNNPTAKKLCLAGIICILATKFMPILSIVSGALSEAFDTSFFMPRYSILLVIVGLVILIITKIRFPQNALSKGLLLGYLANFLASLLYFIIILAIIFAIVSAYDFVGMSDFISELMEIFGEYY